MASLLFWLLVAVVAIIVGGILTAIPFLVIHFIRDILNKKRLKFPKDKKDIKKFIEDNQELLSYKSQEKIDEKEVEKNAQEELRKFREFEKLRRLERKNTGVRNSQQLFTGAKELHRRELLQDESDADSPDNVNGNEQTRKRVKIDK